MLEVPRSTNFPAENPTTARMEAMSQMLRTLELAQAKQTASLSELRGRVTTATQDVEALRADFARAVALFYTRFTQLQTAFMTGLERWHAQQHDTTQEQHHEQI